VLYNFRVKAKKNEEHKFYEGDLSAHVTELSTERKNIEDRIHHHLREKVEYEKWGEFDPADFDYLAAGGVNAYLYELTFDAYANKVGDVPVIVLEKDPKKKLVRLVAFDKITGEIPDSLPDQSPSIVREHDAIRREQLAKVDAEFTALAHLSKQLEKEKAAVQEEIEFESIRLGMNDITDEAAERPLSVAWLSGYVPLPDMDRLNAAVHENGWGICAADPEPDDEEVPTKLENNRFINLINPMISFLDLSPGYRETDISAFFLVFLTLFFGMIFGDAAYGLIILVAAIALTVKTYKSGVSLFTQFLLLTASAAVIWGTLTATWFGLEYEKLPGFLQNLRLPALTGDENLKLFCFTIALVHLSLAHIIRIVRNPRSLKVLAELGRMGMLAGMYFIVLSMIVFNAGFGMVKGWHLGLIGGGFLLMFVFSEFEGNIGKALKASAAKIVEMILSITGVFSDIMSYIRLWAVGLAGAAIAGTVNGFAEPMFANKALFIVALLLFAVCHLFNMVLAAMSFIVHGVRLNTLEFSTHVGLEWTGHHYKPFAKTAE
jgi:V/A-type H+-transporting ATPase subunit I